MTFGVFHRPSKRDDDSESDMVHLDTMGGKRSKPSANAFTSRKTTIRHLGSPAA